MITFLYSGIPEELPISKNGLAYKWDDGFGVVYFSVSQSGDTLICHIMASRKARNRIRIASLQFTNYLFSTYPCANKVVAHAFKSSVKNMCKKIGMEMILSVPKSKNCKSFEIWARFRHG